MKLFLLLSLVFSLNSYSASKNCLMELQDKSITLCGGINWINGLEQRKDIAIELLFWDKNDNEQKLIDPELNLFPYVWMYMDNGVQHGSRSLTVTKLETGKYLIKNLFLIPMRGYWTFQLALSSKKIPQNTSIPMNAEPVTFLNNYEIIDNALLRFDFFKFQEETRKGFLVWNKFSKEAESQAFQVYIHKQNSTKMIKIKQGELEGKVLNSKFVLESALNFSEENGPYYQSNSFMFSAEKEHIITLSIVEDGQSLDLTAIRVNL